MLADLRREELARAAVGLLQRFGGSFEVSSANAVADALEAAHAERDEHLLAMLAGGGPAHAYVRARLLASWGRVSEAEQHLDTCLSSLPLADPEVLALRARWRSRRGDVAGASADLRHALHLFPEYAFHVRTEKLLSKLAGAPQSGARRACKIAILGSSTTALLAPVVRAALFRDRIAAEIYEGPYGAYRQEILDPASGLYRFEPDHVVLLVNHRDLALPPDGALAAAQAAAQELRGLWRALQVRRACHLVQLSFDSPRGGSWGALETTLPEGRRRAIALANATLASDLPPGVSFLDVESLPLPAGTSWTADEGWHAAKQYPTASALPVLADAIAAHVRAAMGLSSKVLVFDLDNTLWAGIIGEDGIGGIRVGPPTADGEGYQELQRYARELRQRGVVLAVCSKNNLADAQLPFRDHDGMVLKLEDFAAFTANWQDKPSNLTALARELSLGIDSFVFLDDNPFERTLIRERLPEVIVPEVSATPWSMLAALRRGMYFEPLRLTAEDLKRNQSYQASTAMRSAQSSGGESLETFLQGLGMVCEHGPVDDRVLQRVTQLINKTNQFNVTTRRYTEAEVRRMMTAPDWWCRWFKLSDRFGDHGLIGVLLAHADGARWTIDTWLMSCRVLGRRAEEFMCACLVAAAGEAGATEIAGVYVPTAKNEMVRDLFPRMGFERGDQDDAYRFLLSASPLPRSPWIRGVAQDSAEPRMEPR